jgi:hypothetical protein
MAKKVKSRTPARWNAIRRDSSVETAEWTIAEKLKLPKGSVRLVNPSGRKARKDKSVERLLEDWGYWS